MPAISLSKVDTRNRLKARREPYWEHVKGGDYLGFRKMTATSVGTWVARHRDPETGAQRYRSLGEYEQHAPSDRRDRALDDARDWFAHLAGGGTKEVVTVKAACEAYVKHVRGQRGEKPAKDIESRFKRWVYESRDLADVELAKLTRTKVERWRANLAKTVVKVDPYAEKPRTRDRSDSSVNRDCTALRAALNHAHDAGQVTTDIAWRVALRPKKNADGRRDVYLDRTQRRQLLEKAPADLAAFLRGLSLLPLRPGALAALTVANIDKRLGVLTVGKDKAGQDRRIKLPETTAAFFVEQTKDKLPAAPLLARADGKAWDKDAWKGPMKEAAAAAELPANVTAYALRHSVITDLVSGGLNLLTVAQISGTSVAMIEKHYGHLRDDHASAALAALAL